MTGMALGLFVRQPGPRWPGVKRSDRMRLLALGAERYDGTAETAPGMDARVAVLAAGLRRAFVEDADVARTRRALAAAARDRRAAETTHSRVHSETSEVRASAAALAPLGAGRPGDPGRGHLVSAGSRAGQAVHAADRALRDAREAEGAASLAHDLAYTELLERLLEMARARVADLQAQHLVRLNEARRWHGQDALVLAEDLADRLVALAVRPPAAITPD
jgi:hypothetical protein